MLPVQLAQESDSFSLAQGRQPSFQGAALGAVSQDLDPGQRREPLPIEGRDGLDEIDDALLRR